MSDPHARLAKAKKDAAHWAAEADRWRADIDRHREGTKAKAHAEAMLAKSKKRQAAANEKIALAQIAIAKLEKLLPLKASLDRRAAAVIAQAPQVQKRWKDERAKEAKKLKDRAKSIQRRITKDKRAPTEPFWRRRGKPAPAALEASTWPTGTIVPYVPPAIEAAPPREGLLPGEYVEGERALRIVGSLMETLSKSRVPERWTPEHVADRMVEAFRTLRRLPMRLAPKEFGTIWPEHRTEQADAFGQTISGAIQDRNRAIRGTGAFEVDRMAEALAWPMEYLRDQPALARAVNEWALWNDLDGDPLDGMAHKGLVLIARGLNRRKVVVR